MRLILCGSLLARYCMLLLTVLILVGMSVDVTRAAEKVTLRLDWTLYGPHAPFYLALEKGFYEKEGLDVKIQEGAGSAKTVQVVGHGGDTFGFADAVNTLKAISAGVPIEMVACLLPKSPMAVISLKESKITTPRDLIGRSVSMTPGDSPSQIFPALLKLNGIDPSKVNVISVDTAAKTALVLTKKADVTVGSAITFVPPMEATGASLNVFYFADYGVATLTHGIVVTTDTISKNPELVPKFVAASIQGYEEARKNPQAAIDATLKHFPRAVAKVLSEQLRMTFQLLETQRTKGRPLGWMAREDWEDTLKVAVDYGGVKAPRPVGDYYTNDFLASR